LTVPGGIFVRPSSDSFVPVPLVHLVGAVVGLAVALGQIVSMNFGPLLSACRLRTPLEAVQR
jgi:hypothetical protein